MRHRPEEFGGRMFSLRGEQEERDRERQEPDWIMQSGLFRASSAERRRTPVLEVGKQPQR